MQWMHGDYKNNHMNIKQSLHIYHIGYIGLGHNDRKDHNLSHKALFYIHMIVLVSPMSVNTQNKRVKASQKEALDRILEKHMLYCTVCGRSTTVLHARSTLPSISTMQVSQV
jgi:hypothetical protein